MKKTIGTLLIFAGLTTAVFAEEAMSDMAMPETAVIEEEATYEIYAETEKKNFFGKVAEGFSTSTRAAGELFKENNGYAMAIGTNSYATAKEDTKDRLSKGFKQGFVDEINKQKANRKQFQENATNLHGTREFMNANRQFSNSIVKYLP